MQSQQESKHGMEDDPMFVITGATGHTGNIVARTLLTKGEKVRVIGRNPDRLKEFAQAGAEPFTADLSDAGIVAKAFAGAKAAFVMMPPNPSSPDVLGFQKRVVDAIASGLQSSGVTHAVVLSSIGADKPDRTGPVLGLHYLEERLNGIDALNVLHLRPGYFMENTLPQAGIIRTAGMVVGPLRADLKLPMIATRDIGAAAVAPHFGPLSAAAVTYGLEALSNYGFDTRFVKRQLKAAWKLATKESRENPYENEMFLAARRYFDLEKAQDERGAWKT